jgi:cell division protein YceG involved in septum cleavage
MLDNFNTKVIKELDINTNSADLQNNLILASIVEKEEKSVKEKATVA